MFRSCSTALVVFLCLIVGSQAIDGPQPVVPPRPGPQIAPEVLPPGPPPLVEPTPDPLEGKFRITASVAGEAIPDEENVELEPGELLTLQIAGQPAAEGEELAAINWGLNRESKHLSIYPADGHHVTFTAPSSGAWLFYAAANNPDPQAAPLLAARWVIVGTPTPVPAPSPPNKPDEPQPTPKPVEPAPATITAVVYVYEKDTGAVPSGVRVALDKLNRSGILATEFEDDTTDGDDDVPLQYQIALNAARAKSLPGELKPSLVVMRGTMPEVWHDVRTEQDVLEAAQ
jgi:hypothetical protein